MVFEHTCYREFLRDELVQRTGKNPQYSLRSFARKIGISHGMLSSVLSGKKNLSSESVYRLGAALGFRPKETEYFLTLLELAKTKHPERKADLHLRLESLAPRAHRPRDLSLEFFRLISDWYHYPVLEWVSLDRSHSDPRGIAQALGITVHEAKSALDRLERVGLLERDGMGGYSRPSEEVLAAARVPNEALRKFHRQMLEKAIESLEAQTPQEKFVGSETMGFSPEALPEATAILEDCFQKLIACSKRQKRNSQVYHLGIQFFRLTQGKTEKKKS